MPTARKGLHARLCVPMVSIILGLLYQLSFASEGLHEMKLKATEFAFQPTKVVVADGTVTFVVTNEGALPHALAIEGVKETLPRIDPDQTLKLTVNLSKGTYVFYCPLVGHRERGMEGRLAVGSPSENSLLRQS